MPQAIVWIFIAISSVFAAVHNIAVTASLYWYYSWFDIIMHFWGGMLVVLGVYALCSLKHVPLKPSTILIFFTLFFIMIMWELFERLAGLYNPATYVFDVSKDLLVGTIGGLLAYLVALRFRMYR
jgi:hypothetical protein